MTDPFSALGAEIVPVDPDPGFTTRLRADLERALALPRGVVPLATVIEPPAVVGAAVPYLAVADARAALDWYVDVFGARVVGDPYVMEDGRIGHSELEFASGLVYLSDAHPELGVTAPRPGEAAVSLMLPVDDADAVRVRAVGAGAAGDRPPYDGYGERHAWIVDPFGHRWGLHSPLPAAADAGYRHGELTHVSIRTPDAARAVQFYRGVLGWDVVDDRVAAASPSVGLWTADEPTLLCVYAVDDLAVARERVVAAGGTAGEPRREPYGLRADCTDDQGVAFSIHEVEPGTPKRPGGGPGDLEYVVLEVVDSTRARAFYEPVLGLVFTPGRDPDHWQAERSTPVLGMSGGHRRAAAVPMWRVGDLGVAVAAVREHGGAASEPERQPYGMSSLCTDDQGSRFWLLEG